MDVSIEDHLIKIPTVTDNSDSQNESLTDSIDNFAFPSKDDRNKSPDSAIEITPDSTPDEEPPPILHNNSLGARNKLKDSEEEDLQISEAEMVVSGSMHFSLNQNHPSGVESDVEDKGEDNYKVGYVPANASSNLESNVPKQYQLEMSNHCAEYALPETVTKLSTEEGSEVYVVGTAHFSRESQEDVSKTIRLVKPDIVMVELCKSRTAILQLDEETILNEAKSMDFGKMRQILSQHGKIEGILYILLLSVSAHITKQLGMAPGGEFRTAFSEARQSVPGCAIHLGDRPIHVTLSRALASLSAWQKIKLTFHILTSKEPISKEEVEKCKNRDFIEELLAEMTGQFPAISEVFVNERDIYLTKSLQIAAQPIPNPSSPLGYSSRTVVGIVGIGHVPGIVKLWGKVKDEDIPPIMIIPPPNLSDRIVKVSFKLALVGLIGIGVYLAIPRSTKNMIYTSVKSSLESSLSYVSLKKH